MSLSPADDYPIHQAAGGHSSPRDLGSKLLRPLLLHASQLERRAHADRRSRAVPEPVGARRVRARARGHDAPGRARLAGARCRPHGPLGRSVPPRGARRAAGGFATASSRTSTACRSTSRSRRRCPPCSRHPTTSDSTSASCSTRSASPRPASGKGSITVDDTTTEVTGDRWRGPRPFVGRAARRRVRATRHRGNRRGRAGDEHVELRPDAVRRLLDRLHLLREARRLTRSRERDARLVRPEAARTRTSDALSTSTSSSPGRDACAGRSSRSRTRREARSRSR